MSGTPAASRGPMTPSLLAVLALGYAVAVIDRLNIGVLKLSLEQDVPLGPALFGLGAGLFFLAYSACEAPSNLMLLRFGPRRWLAGLAATWGLVTLASVAVQGPVSFVAARVALGIAEAGYFPGVVLLVHRWLPPAVRARAMAVLLVAGSAAGLVTGSLVGSVLSVDGSPGGLRPWQWAFVMTGMPALLLAAVLARWLPARLDAAPPPPSPTPRQPLDVRRLLGCGLALAALQALLYGVLFWLPTWLQQAGITDLRTNGLCQALPHLLALPALWWVARTVRQARHGVRWAARAGLLAAVAGALLGSGLAMAAPSPWLLLVSAAVAVAALTSALAAFWVYAADDWGSPATQGVAIGLVNGLGAIGSCLGPLSIGLVLQAR